MQSRNNKEDFYVNIITGAPDLSKFAYGTRKKYLKKLTPNIQYHFLHKTEKIEHYDICYSNIQFDINKVHLCLNCYKIY